MPYRSPAETLVGCIWAPRFAVQVECKRYPELVGQSLALLSVSMPPVVVALSREAQQAGVRREMPFREVMAIAPHTICRTADAHCYEQAFAEMLRELETVSPLIEPGPVGQAYLNLEGLVRGDGYAGLRRPSPGAPGRYVHAQLLMAALERAIRPPWAARIGVGEGKFVASAAARVTVQEVDPATFVVSRSGKTCWVRAGMAPRFLAPLPVEALRIEEEMQRRLFRFGIRRLKELAALPAPAVAAQFGKAGREAWLLARGEDNEPLRPRDEFREVVETLQFAEPEAALAAFLAAAQQLLERAMRRPEAQGRGVRQVRLDALLESSHTWTHTQTFKQPGARPESLIQPLCFLLEREHPTEAVEQLSLAITAFTPSLPGGQMSLFPEPGRIRRARLGNALRQLRVQMGDAPISRVVEVEPHSRIPERRYHLLNCDG